ncbi:MAG TPA: lipid II flippase MurJ [Candidatus Limnocylindrales bacterium]
MARSPVDLVRTLIDRIFPRGALILSVLSFAYFVAGIVRNRIFANTFGAGPELDAYNAAIRIPEIALDVLVAAGLTAPFVPIYTALRHDDEDAANTFGRTVLTAAVLVMTVAVVAIFLAAPWLATQIGAGFDAPTRELYVDLVRINCLAQILFAASICLGEVLVAHRRFLFYALAPILYTGGIIAGTLAGRVLGIGIEATAWGAVAGAAMHLGIRALGILRTSFRPRPAFRVRTPAFREFVRLMLPRMVSHPIEPAIFTFFTALATTIAVGGVTTINFALDYQVVPVSLIGIAFSLAVFPTLSMAYADGDQAAFRSILGRNVVTIGALTTLAAIALFIGSGILVEVLLGGGEFGAADVARTATIVAAFAVSVPFDALAYPLSRGLYATHDTIRQVIASFVGFGTVLAASNALVPGLGLLAIPVGYAIGMAVKDALLVAFLIPRVRSIGRPAPRQEPVG